MGEATILVVVALAVAGVALKVVVPSLTAAGAATMEEVTILPVAAITVAGAAIIGEVIIMAVAATIGEVTIMAEDLIIGEVTGVGVSGSARDGVGLDGVRGGVPRTIHTRTIHTMRHPL